MAARVMVYGTAWCEMTRELRIFLTRERVLHDFHNVEVNAPDRAAAQTMNPWEPPRMNSGKYSVPVVVVETRIMRNPALGVLRRELHKRGLLSAEGSTEDRVDDRADGA